MPIVNINVNPRKPQRLEINNNAHSRRVPGNGNFAMIAMIKTMGMARTVRNRPAVRGSIPKTANAVAAGVAPHMTALKSPAAKAAKILVVTAPLQWLHFQP